MATAVQPIVKAVLSRDRLGELQRIGGSALTGLTPAAILEHAKVKSSALHSLFDWNDTTAAQRYRQIQAAAVVKQAVRILKAEGAGTVHRVAARVVPAPKPEVARKPMADSSVDQVYLAKQEYWAWREKWREVPELAPAFAVMDKAIGELATSRKPLPQEITRRCARCQARSTGVKCNACGAPL